MGSRLSAHTILSASFQASISVMGMVENSNFSHFENLIGLNAADFSFWVTGISLN